MCCGVVVEGGMSGNKGNREGKIWVIGRNMALFMGESRWWKEMVSVLFSWRKGSGSSYGAAEVNA